MAKSFELETLQMRLNDAQFQRLGLHQRIQRALRALILDGALSPGEREKARDQARKKRDEAREAYAQALTGTDVASPARRRIELKLQEVGGQVPDPAEAS